MSISQVEQSILFDSNMYLVIGTDATALIDTGTGFKNEPSLRSIRDLLSGRPLDHVILTHRHYDHVGGLTSIIREFHPKLHAGHLDAIPLREGDSESTLGTMFGGSIEPMDVEDFNEGDVIDLGGHVLTPYDTPGHTIGSIVVLDKVTGALFSGDTLFVDGVGNYSHPTGSGEMLVQSLRKLKDIDFSGLYPGHGPVVREGGKDYIQKGLRIMGIQE